jgi:2-haloalkanoic acid dehalogenase type II
MAHSLINDFTQMVGDLRHPGRLDRVGRRLARGLLRLDGRGAQASERGYQILDTLHRQSLEKMVAQFEIKGLSDADLHHLTMGWHRLHPWPDSVDGLTRLKTKYIISPLSNGNVALLTNMAKFAGLPWDLVMSAELFEHYKPDPETYLGAAKLLCLPPEQVMMVAAHNHDLKAAQKLGLRPPSSHGRPNTARSRNMISRPRATGTSSPRILAASPTGWGARSYWRIRT